MPKYTLRYFAGPWGDISRLILVSQGQEFEDKTFTPETFPAEKANTPFGQLPVVSIDGKHYTEKEPTERFLAREFDLRKTLDEETIPRYIGNIETLMAKKEKGYCVGKKLSLGDITIHYVINGWVDDAELSNYPSVEAIVNNVRSNEKIKAYLAKRKGST